MKVLEIIHGYPPQYNAGSENYTEAVVNELVRRGQGVAVFCREENQFLAEYNVRITTTGKRSKISKFVINVARNKDRFMNSEIDAALERILDTFNPDVAHIEHLNHLSLGIPKVLKKKGIPIVYTLHDFWLMCPRGQFIQFNLHGEPWRLCNGQENSKCAKICYERYHTGIQNTSLDVDYWTSWVSNRMKMTREAVDYIDLFIAPSHTVQQSFLRYFPEAASKVRYLDYGFNLEKLKKRKRNQEGDSFVFGYIGTHIPTKGIDYLIRAFGKLKGATTLRIWGRSREEYTPYLKSLSLEAEQTIQHSIQWMGEFDGNKIVEQVFNNVDAIVVPSIWQENSPLVIHEAQQTRVPIITADTGGMAEYVRNGENGLLFKFRDTDSLASTMQVLVDDPTKAVSLGRRGYLYSQSGDVLSVESHVEYLLGLFSDLIKG